MPRLSRGSVVQLQAINESIRYAGHAPKAATHPPGFYLRALRGKMRMSQAQLARRSGVDQGQIARIELGKVEAELKTLRKLFDALFCDLLVIPKPRQHLGDALAARNAEWERPDHGHTSLRADQPPK
ncbi:MAG: helix-turn-helix transcriptional regulator [Elusimicrobia bacterium]|nr:helix-turn-helix transcriptional regulator [Elusimicrobiota bacterium]